MVSHNYLNKKQWIDFTTEIIQMSQTPDFLVRNAFNWYEHGLVRQGYTNMNQIMGAGSGKGNNVQTFATSWHSGLSMLGIKTQRIQHDPVQADAQSKVVTLGQREHIWTDYVFSLEGRYRYKNWLVNVNVNWVKAMKFGFEFRIAFHFVPLFNKRGSVYFLKVFLKQGHTFC